MDDIITRMMELDRECDRLRTELAACQAERDKMALIIHNLKADPWDVKGAGKEARRKGPGE